MRKGGWQLPYHPLQVVAIAVFLALGFAFYVFFVPFVGGDVLQYVLLGLCTPLITSVVVLFVWCAATDPGDPGIFKLKRHLRMPSNSKHEYPEEKSLSDGCCAVNDIEKLSNIFEGKDSSSHPAFSRVLCLICTPFSCLCKRCFHSDDQSLEQHASEEGMFVCSLCEAEVLQHSKHCRVCDKCVDGFDHHCGVFMVCTRSAYNAVVGGCSCVDSLLYEARGVFWADRFKAWKQLLDCGFCSCCGGMFVTSNDCNNTTLPTFVVPHSSYQERNQYIRLHCSFERARTPRTC